MRRFMIAGAPALLSAAFVFAVYADTGTVLYELPRALTGAITISLFFQAIGIAASGTMSGGSLFAVALLAVAIDLRALAIVLIVAIAWLWSRRTGRSLEPSGGVALIVAILFILSVARAASSDGFDLADMPRSANGGDAEPSLGPDIYLVMLDGYPRSDTLAEFGYDNNRFIKDLSERGFHVATSSSTNYPFTGLVLATMMNMKHLQEIDALVPVPDTDIGQLRALSVAINRNPALRTLEERGYWTASTGLTEVRGTVRDVDQYLDAGEIRLWERQVMQRTSLWPILCEAIVIPQHRSLIESTFRHIEAAAADGRSDPTFLFAHVMSPHTPIVFDRDGGPPEVRGSAGCEYQFAINAETIGLDDTDYGHAMADQVHYLNTKTIAAIDQILAASPDAVVIVFSDHGARFTPEPSEEWFHSFFAARTPGHDRLFGDDARPIEIFPTLFSAYFGQSYPEAEDRSFVSATGGIVRLLDVVPWPSP